MQQGVLVLSPSGNFQTVASINTYLSQLLNNISNSTNNTNVSGAMVEVRGLNTVASSTSLNFSSLVKFIGSNGTLSFTGGATINNVKFTDLNITVNAPITISNTVFDNCTITVNSSTGFLIQSNCNFNNCTITNAYDATSDGYFTVGNFGNFGLGSTVNPGISCLLGTTTASLTSITNVLINNCTFNTSLINYFPFVSFLINNQAHYLEKITISNNKFNNTSAIEDQRAVMGIVSTITSASTPAINGPRAVNVNIENNVCNKDQMFAITATFDSNNTVQNMIAPVEVNIKNNVCGTINYLTKQDTSLTSTNATQISDKDNILTISNNTTKFIFSGFSDGYFNIFDTGHPDNGHTTVQQIATGNGLFTSSIIIQNNTCSWIAACVRSSSSYGARMPLTIIDKNNLTAYNSTFQFSYINTGAFTSPNVGVLVYSVQGS